MNLDMAFARNFLKGFLCFGLLFYYQATAQVAIVIEAILTAPFSVAINTSSVLNSPESVVHIKGLDTTRFTMHFYQEGQKPFSREVYLREIGTHWYQLQRDKAGNLQLRYRGNNGKLPNGPPYLYVPLPDVVEPHNDFAVDVFEENPIKTPESNLALTQPFKPSLQGFIEKLERTDIEFEKVSLLRDFLEDNTFDTDDVIVLSRQLKFEHSKLQFFIQALAKAALNCSQL